MCGIQIVVQGICPLEIYALKIQTNDEHEQQQKEPNPKMNLIESSENVH